MTSGRSATGYRNVLSRMNSCNPLRHIRIRSKPLFNPRNHALNLLPAMQAMPAFKTQSRTRRQDSLQEHALHAHARGLLACKAGIAGNQPDSYADLERRAIQSVEHEGATSHLVGPRRTPWGTLVWSDPDEPSSIEWFGPPKDGARMNESCRLDVLIARKHRQCQPITSTWHGRASRNRRPREHRPTT